MTQSEKNAAAGSDLSSDGSMTEPKRILLFSQPG